jgi:hypothetical protein
MLIELRDRQHWLDLCDERIKSILAQRAAEDADYEKQWRKRSWPFKDRSDTAKPPTQLFYPSIASWGTLNTARRLKRVLENPYTGIVKLTDGEFELIT